MEILPGGKAQNMDNLYYKIRILTFDDRLLDGLMDAVENGMPYKIIAARFGLTLYTTRKLIKFAMSPWRALRNPEDVIRDGNSNRRPRGE